MRNIFSTINSTGLRNACIWSIVGGVVSVGVAIASIFFGLPIWAGIVIGLATDLIWDLQVLNCHRSEAFNFIRSSLKPYTTQNTCKCYTCVNYETCKEDTGEEVEEETDIEEDTSTDYPQEETEDDEEDNKS